MVFTSEAQLQATMKSAMSTAIDNTCEKLLKVLQEYIMVNYYNQFTPEKYERTFQFYESAIKQMVGELTGQISMEAGMMSYTGKDPVWTGEQQLLGAQSGYHGQLALIGGGEFWSKFLAYFGANALPMLKQELRSQGVPIK